ncbi:histidine phosphatase family protein [Actinoplanes sp. NPDC051470]|uniref:histidine phosphatase family protein n=1 Tax=Actinoplanes sp. NPDC051470 TaxID=3157224 RepID=UPI0034457886
MLVRHARSVPPTADGPDELTRPLTPEGLRQADELVAVLAELGPTAAWSSPYRRAIQTIRPTARFLGLSVHTDGELREWDDGLAYTDDWEPHYAESWAHPSHARPEGESLEQLRTRAVGAVRMIVHRGRGRVVLVAGHGTFIAQALSGFGHPLDRDAWQRMPMPAIYRLRFTELTAPPEVSEIA